MKTIEELSKILGIYLTRESMDREIKILQSSGGISQRHIIDIIIMIIKKLDDYEKKGAL